MYQAEPTPPLKMYQAEPPPPPTMYQAEPPPPPTMYQAEPPPPPTRTLCTLLHSTSNANIVTPTRTRCWEKNKLTMSANIYVCNAHVLSTFSLAAKPRHPIPDKSASFHLRYQSGMPWVSREHRVPNTQILIQAITPSMFVTPSHSDLRWLGCVRCIEDGRLPKAVQ